MPDRMRKRVGLDALAYHIGLRGRFASGIAVLEDGDRDPLIGVRGPAWTIAFDFIQRRNVPVGDLKQRATYASSSMVGT